RRAYRALPRTAAACNRVLLPAAARENLAQVLEYEIEHLVPLPRDQVYFDYSVRGLGEDRLEILLMCIPREIVRVHLEALEDAFVRPRGVVLTSTAIADYLAFCRGGAAATGTSPRSPPDASRRGPSASRRASRRSSPLSGRRSTPSARAPCR